MSGFYREDQGEKVHQSQRQVRKLNNLINKKEGNITWQSSQVLPAARASHWENNRQAGNRVQAGNSIQAGRLALTSSPQASLPPLGVISPRQAVPRLPWEIALSQWQRVRSPRQAAPRLSWKIIFSHQQRVSSPVLAIPRPLWQIACSHQQRVRPPRQAVPRKAVPKQAVPSLPQKIALSHWQRVHSPRQAVPKLPQQVALFQQQRVRSPRQATPRFPKLPRKTTFSHLQRVSSPRQVPPLPQRKALCRQRALHLLRQSGAWQSLGLDRQVPYLGRSARSPRETVLFPKGYFPRTMLHKKQGPPPVGITPHRVLPLQRYPTQSG